MGKIKIAVILSLFIISCATEQRFGDAGSKEDCTMFSTRAVHCLRDFLTGEDAGGLWQQVGTTPQDLSGLLVGENPCFEWSDKACGQYTFRYIVGDDCCRDTSIIAPIKCCLEVGIDCN